MSKSTFVIAAIGVLIMAFLGVIAGREFLQWREQEDLANRMGRAESGEASRLKPGDPLPDAVLKATDKSLVRVRSLAEHSDLVILFVSISCEPCSEAVRNYGPVQPGLPRVIAVCEDDVAYARVYAEESRIPFPVYSDTASTFFEEYGIEVFPSAVGVKRGGVIAFVRHGVTGDFNIDYAKTRFADPN